jgi:Tfp pilus assembly protein PilZ
MWQAPGQRGRALAAQKKRERERQKQSLHMRRVRAEIKISQPMMQAIRTEARVILNDFNYTGLGLFTENSFLAGQEVALTLEEPVRFFVRGRVVWCQEYETSAHVVCQTTYRYRVGIEFIFDSPEEQAAVQAYCDELLSKYVLGGQAA